MRLNLTNWTNHGKPGKRKMTSVLSIRCFVAVCSHTTKRFNVWAMMISTTRLLGPNFNEVILILAPICGARILKLSAWNKSTTSCCGINIWDARTSPGSHSLVRYHVSIECENLMSSQHQGFFSCTALSCYIWPGPDEERARRHRRPTLRG